MRKLLAAIGLFSTLGFSSLSSAYADVTQHHRPHHHHHPHTCGFSYDIKGGGLQVGLGMFKLKGHGTITCVDHAGNKTVRDAVVTFGGSPIAPRVAIGALHLKGVTGSFGWNGDIDELYGSYLVADVKAAAIGGVGASAMLENPKHGIRIGLGIEGIAGLGFETGLSVMKFKRPKHNCHRYSNSSDY